MKALTLSTFGSSEVLEYREINNPVLKEGEVLIEMKAVGLNFCRPDAKERSLSDEEAAHPISMALKAPE